MTEGPTLLPPARSDKRTKEGFALSLERMTGRSGLGLGEGMRRMDYGLSGEWMARAITVALSDRSHAPRGNAAWGRVRASALRNGDAERHGMHSHAKRGNDHYRLSNSPCHEPALLILLQATMLSGLSGRTARFHRWKKSQT